MALTDESGNGFYMPVAPAYGGNGGFGGGFGGDWGWIILLLLFAGGGWGMGGFGGGMMWPMMMGAGMGGFGMDYLYPWLNNSQNINDGFRDQMLNDGVTSLRDGLAALSTQLCQCCGDMQMALANGFANAETAANARQMATMQQNFALQQAMSQGFNGVQLQQCQASGENRLGIADLKYTVATENCADRTQSMQNTRDIIDAIGRGNQSILDRMFQDKMDQKNDEIGQLRQELLYARGQASQNAQDTRIINGVYDRLATCPVNSVPVYGDQRIFSCPNQNNNGCGCGCGSF